MTSIGSVHGDIVIDYDSRGVAHARNSLGQFVSQADGFSKSLGLSSAKGSSGFNLLGLNVLKAAKYITLASSAAVSLASTISIAGSAIAALAPVVGAGLAVLPGIILGAASAFLIFKAAVAGVGDALKAAASGDAQAFNDALKKLSPSAREAATAFRDLMVPLKQVQQNIQQTFFAGTAPLIRNISKSVADLKIETAGVASGMNGLFREVLTVGSSPDLINPIAQLMVGLSETLQGMAGSLTPLIVGFASLAGQAGAFGATFGSSIGGALATFGTFLQSIDLTTVFQNAMTVLRPLGQLFQDIGTIAMSVFNALNSAGPGTLGMIGQLVSQIAAFTSSDAGTAALSALGAAMQAVAGAAGQALMSLLSALAPSIVAIAPLVGQLASVLGGALSQAFAALAPAVLVIVQALTSALLPVLPVIAGLFSQLMPIIAQIAGVIAGALAPILIALGPVIQVIGEVIGAILMAALQALMPILQALLPPFVALVQAVLPPLIPIIQLLGTVIIALMPILLLVTNLLTVLLVPIMKILGPVIQVVAAVLTFLIGIIVALITPITNMIARMTSVQALTAIWNTVFTFIRNLVTLVVGWIVERIQFAAAAWFQIFTNMKNIAMAIWALIVQSIRNFITTIITIFGFLVSLPGRVAGYFGEMRDAVISRVAALVGFVRGIPGQILGALGNLAGLLRDAGERIIQGLIDGIKNMAGRVKNAVSDVMQSARNLLPFSPAKEGPFSGSGWSFFSGESIMEDLAAGMIRGTQAVREAMSGSLGGLAGGINVTASGGLSAGATIPLVRGGTNLTVHQVVNALPGQDAAEVGNHALRRLAFGVKTGTSSVVAAVGD